MQTREYETMCRSLWQGCAMTGRPWEAAMRGGDGAGEGNRTLVVSLGSCCSTIELHPRHLLITHRARPSQGQSASACLVRQLRLGDDGKEFARRPEAKPALVPLADLHQPVEALAIDERLEVRPHEDIGRGLAGLWVALDPERVVRPGDERVADIGLESQGRPGLGLFHLEIDRHEGL